jgi:hypothetical protein
MSTIQLVEYMNETIASKNAEIERLNARLGVLQDAADHCIIGVWPVITPALYDALWGDQTLTRGNTL